MDLLEERLQALTKPERKWDAGPQNISAEEISHLISVLQTAPRSRALL
jgi:hypothetical protein